MTWPRLWVYVFTFSRFDGWVWVKDIEFNFASVLKLRSLIAMKKQKHAKKILDLIQLLWLLGNFSYFGCLILYISGIHHLPHRSLFILRYLQQQYLTTNDGIRCLRIPLSNLICHFFIFCDFATPPANNITKRLVTLFKLTVQDLYYVSWQANLWVSSSDNTVYFTLLCQCASHTSELLAAMVRIKDQASPS